MFSIVIVNWNSGNQLYDCVNNLINSSESRNFEIIVVDNNSIDNSLKLVEEFDYTKIIKLTYNAGFSKACNIGSFHANSEYVIFLNPDTIVYKDTLCRLEAFIKEGMSNYGRVGIIGVQLLNEKNEITKTCARFPTPLSIFLQSIALDKIFSSYSHFMLDWDHSNTQKVHQIMGAFFCVNRELFVQLERFDENFFVYYEEVDFSLRAYKNGWNSIYFAGAQIYHKGGGTTSQVKDLRLFYLLRSRLLYSKKHYSKIQYIFIFFITFFIESFTRVFKCLISFSVKDIKNILKGYSLLFSWYKKNKIHI